MQLSTVRALEMFCKWNIALFPWHTYILLKSQVEPYSIAINDKIHRVQAHIYYSHNAEEIPYLLKWFFSMFTFIARLGNYLTKPALFYVSIV